MRKLSLSEVERVSGVGCFSENVGGGILGGMAGGAAVGALQGVFGGIIGTAVAGAAMPSV